MKHVSIEVEAKLDNLTRAAEFMDTTLSKWDVPADKRGRLALAADEVITNVFLYAYPDEEKGTVTISLQHDGRRVSISVVDRGMPFDPTQHPEPDTSLTIEEREIGGLGIHLTRQMVDDLRYDRSGDENRLTLGMVVGTTAETEHE